MDGRGWQGGVPYPKGIPNSIAICHGRFADALHWISGGESTFQRHVGGRWLAPEVQPRELRLQREDQDLVASNEELVHQRAHATAHTVNGRGKGV